jgi:hypothetical protein
MDSITDTINEIRALMEETVSYLHSWCCTRNGEYHPTDYRGVKMAVISLLGGSAVASREESHDIIGSFKNGVRNGSIMIGTQCFGLSKDYEEELYKKHAEHVKHFEEKYNIANERN